MSSEKVNKLVESLLSRTRAGRVDWIPGPRDDMFIWSGSSASVVLLTTDNDGRAPFIVRITDHEGRVIEDELFDNANWGVANVRALYDLARSRALNIEETLDALLGELDE